MPADLSVIVPTYGRAPKTQRAIRSVIAQDGPRIEIIVVDDASPQPFVPAADLRDVGLRILRLPQNGGPAAARNAGVEASQAPYIAFLDSDDFLLPGTLSARLAALAREPTDSGPILLAASVWRWVPGGSAELFTPMEADAVSAFASGCWYFPGSTSIFSRDTWNSVGPLDARLRRLEDLDWGIRLALAGGRLMVTPEPAAVIERSPRAGLDKVSDAAAKLIARYSSGGTGALDGSSLARLKAYLALEKASSALGERRMAQFALEFAASFLNRPRLSLHQETWWRSRASSAEEFAMIEGFAASFAQSSESELAPEA